MSDDERPGWGPPPEHPPAGASQPSPSVSHLEQAVQQVGRVLNAGVVVGHQAAEGIEGRAEEGDEISTSHLRGQEEVPRAEPLGMSIPRAGSGRSGRRRRVPRRFSKDIGGAHPAKRGRSSARIGDVVKGLARIISDAAVGIAESAQDGRHDTLGTAKEQSRHLAVHRSLSRDRRERPHRQRSRR